MFKATPDRATSSLTMSCSSLASFRNSLNPLAMMAAPASSTNAGGPRYTSQPVNGLLARKRPTSIDSCVILLITSCKQKM
eukprot:940269-Lingulodinium_polyedra.AAC.1